MTRDQETDDPQTEDPQTEDPRIKDPVHGLKFCQNMSNISRLPPLVNIRPSQGDLEEPIMVNCFHSFCWPCVNVS